MGTVARAMAESDDDERKDPANSRMERTRAQQIQYVGRIVGKINQLGGEKQDDSVISLMKKLNKTDRKDKPLAFLRAEETFMDSDNNVDMEKWILQSNRVMKQMINDAIFKLT